MSCEELYSFFLSVAYGVYSFFLSVAYDLLLLFLLIPSPLLLLLHLSFLHPVPVSVSVVEDEESDAETCQTDDDHVVPGTHTRLHLCLLTKVVKEV